MNAKQLSKEEQRFVLIQFICVDLLPKPLADILVSQIKPNDLNNKIKSCQALWNGKKLRIDQQNLCLIKQPDYGKFDVSLLYTLIRNLCSSPRPTQGWGNDPQAADINIGDDIERVRIFRNTYQAHNVKTKFTDSVFESIYSDIESTINRIQIFTKKIGCKTDYLQMLKRMKDLQFGYSDFERVLIQLKAILQIDGPQISIKGKDEVICGDTAYFEVSVTPPDILHYPITWQRVRGKITEEIDTKDERYHTSSDAQLIIKPVCKKDEGTYQAVFLQFLNGKQQVISNSISLKILGEPPSLELKDVTKREDTCICIQYQCRVSPRSPEVCTIKWTKNGETLDLNNEKYLGGKLDETIFTIRLPVKEDRGIYSCTVANAVGPISRDMKLDVPFAKIPNELTVYCGQTAKLESEISSCPSPNEAYWQKSKKDFHIIDIGEPKYEGSSTDPSSPLLLIPKTTLDDQVYYQLLVRNIFGEHTSDKLYLKVIGSFPNITISHNTCVQKHSVTLIGKVFLYSGNLPAIHDVLWSKNGDDIDIMRNEDKYSENNLADPSLTIFNVDSNDAGSYHLTVTNEAGPTRSDVIVFGVPEIEFEGAEKKKDGRVFFKVTIKSIPAPFDAQWSIKENNGSMFRLIDNNAEEYKGTSNAFPHSVLVVYKKNLEKYSFQLKVENFIGSNKIIIPGDIYSEKPKSGSSRDGGAVLSTFCIDGGTRVRFADIFNEIAETFPEEKLDQLKDLIKDACNLGDPTFDEQGITSRDCFRRLKDNDLFNPTDVICVQYLLKRTGCQELYRKCIDYAESGKVLYFYEKPPDKDKKTIQFHLGGNLSDYCRRDIENIKETIAAIVGCKKEDIHENGFRHSSSFLMVLSMKEVYIRKLLVMKQKDKDTLYNLNITFFIYKNERFYLSLSKANMPKRKYTNDDTKESLPKKSKIEIAEQKNQILKIFAASHSKSPQNGQDKDQALDSTSRKTALDKNLDASVCEDQADISTQAPLTPKSMDWLQTSIVEFQFGPQQLNLYKYVAEESHFLWEKAKQHHFMREESEPIDGLLLTHSTNENPPDLGLKFFNFSPESTNYKAIDGFSKRLSEMVVVVYPGQSFWKESEQSRLQKLEAVMKNTKKVNLFFIAFCEDEAKQARYFLNKYNICPEKNLISEPSEINSIYEKLYDTLEKNLLNFLSDLEEVTSIQREVATKSEISELVNKLHARKKKVEPIMTDLCRQKILKKYDLAGYMVKGNTLYLFEDETKSITSNQRQKIVMTIRESFPGKVVVNPIKHVMKLYCGVKCGDLMQNSANGTSATIGIFGEIKDMQGAAKDTRTTVVLSSSHFSSSGDIVTHSTVGRIGECIYPSSSIFDGVSVTLIDPFVTHSLKKYIFEENVKVDELSKEMLLDRMVFKYGAATHTTFGFIQQFGDFQLFERDVLVIKSKNRDEAFSQPGDSGAVVLTRCGDELYAIGMVVGTYSIRGEECKDTGNEVIAVFLKKAVDRFKNETKCDISFDKI